MEQPRLTITPFYSRPEELSPPVSTFVLSGGTRIVIIDPGPGWHVQAHLNEIARIVPEKAQVVAVIQAPGPGIFSALDLLRSIGTGHTVVMHWKASIVAAADIEGWETRSLTTKSVRLPLSDTAKLTIGVSPYGGAPGALLSYDRGTGTLFSGPFFGSLGVGQDSDLPLLRRESVRAFHDVMNPSMPHDIVELVFGADLAINQIAPSFGRLATGGSSLIEEVFRDSVSGPPLAAALTRLFVRAAALVGRGAAEGVFRAAGTPVPDFASGFAVMKNTDAQGLRQDDWTKVLDSMEQWFSGAALAGLLPLAAELAKRFDLPLGKSAERFARAAAPPWSETGNGDRIPRRAFGTADMPGTIAPDPDAASDSELTDSATGLMNERVYKRRLAGQVQNTSVPEGSGSVIVVSVDNIRRINASFGRSGGDDALYTVAYLLRNFQAAHSRRGAHRLYRLAGPHFGYVVSNGSVAEGADNAERIRRIVSESAMFLEQLTVSCGVVGIDEIREAAAGDETPDTLADLVTSRAFARLKVAQVSGANTVSSADPTGTTRMGGGSTVLIADPDAAYLDMLTAVIEEQGFTVVIAKDGGEARSVIDQIVPDAIVAEVMLPKMNGFTLRDELRHDARLSQIPYVLVSHRKTDETIEKASMLGIVHFLSKPFSLIELTGLLRNLTQVSGVAREIS